MFIFFRSPIVKKVGSGFLVGFCQGLQAVEVAAVGQSPRVLAGIVDVGPRTVVVHSVD
jgi:hypothetical protein